MASISILKTTPAAFPSGAKPALAHFPQYDSAHFIAPTTNATLTNFLSGTSATIALAAAHAGRMAFKFGSTVVWFPCFLASAAGN